MASHSTDCINAKTCPARDLINAGQFEDALVMLEEHRELALARGHPASEIRHKFLSALCHLGLGLYKRGVQMLQQIIDASCGILRINAMSSLARCYEKLGSYSEAEKTIRDAYNMARAEFGASNSNTVRVQLAYAKQLLRLGHRDHAEDELATTAGFARIGGHAEILAEVHKVATAEFPDFREVDTDNLAREIEMDSLERDLDGVASVLIETVDRLMAKTATNSASTSVSAAFNDNRSAKRARIGASEDESRCDD